MKTIAHQKGVGSHGRADCFVQTLTNLFVIPYGEAEKLATASGWNVGKGISPYDSFKALRKQGAAASILGHRNCARSLYYNCERLTYEFGGFSPTLSAWLKTPEAQIGRYAVAIRGHIFAVIDGTIYDARSNPAQSRVYATYKL